MDNYFTPIDTCRGCLNDFWIEDLNDAFVCYLCDQKKVTE